MALKDWKQFRNNKFQKGWKNEKIEQEVGVFGYFIGNGKYRWSWSVWNDDEEIIAGSKTPNLTQSQAMTYAKNYMRSH